MAETAAGEHNRGDMEIAGHAATYRAFNNLLHWGALFLAAFLSFWTLWLCAHAGFFPSAIVAVVILGLGTWWLRRPKAH